MSSANEVTDKKAYVHRLENTAYKLRCLKAEPGTSQSGQKKGSLLLEIFDAKPQKFHSQNGEEGDLIDLNGLTIYDTISFSPKAIQPFTNPKLLAFGLPPVDEDSAKTFDVKVLEGRTCAAICKTELQEKKNAVTGEVIVNPNTGKPVMDFRRVVDQYLPLE